MRRWLKPRPAALAGPRVEDLDRLAQMLAAAERPLVWVGGAVHPADVADVARLAESWMLPVMPSAPPTASCSTRRTPITAAI